MTQVTEKEKPADSSSLLLDSIKKGIPLRRAADRVLAEKPKSEASRGPVDVASILQAGLEKKFANTGDDDSDSGSDSDDDWSM